jgi:hypothetical protein
MVGQEVVKKIIHVVRPSMLEALIAVELRRDILPQGIGRLNLVKEMEPILTANSFLLFRLPIFLCILYVTPCFFSK